MKLFFAAAFLLLALTCIVDARAILSTRSRWVGAYSFRSYRRNPVRRDESLQDPNKWSSIKAAQRRKALHVRRQEQQKEQEQQEQQQPQVEQQQGQGGGLRIGNLVLGGPDGGISAPGLQLGGNQQQQQEQQQQQQAPQEGRNETAAPVEQAPAAPVEQPPAAPVEQLPAPEREQPPAPVQEIPTPERPFVLPEAEQPAPAQETPALERPSVLPEAQTPSAGPGTENQPGRAEGEAARQEAEQEAKAAKGEGEKAAPNKAVEESEQFSEGFGIVLDEAGNTKNLGGNLGITQGSDGSKSVGGSNGINIAPNGEATVAGNE